MIENTLFMTQNILQCLLQQLKIITYGLENLILGQVKIGEHQAKCRALAVM